MMSFVREGDSVYIESISRITRSTKNLLNIIEELKKKRVEFISLKKILIHLLLKANLCLLFLELSLS